MRRFLFSTFVVALFFSSATAFAVRPLTPGESRTIAGTLHFKLASASEITVGQNGVVAAIPIDGAANGHSVWTSSIAALPYACKPVVQVLDDASADTLSCTTINLTGKDQFGLARTETLHPSGETATEATKVFESFSRIEAIGCTSNSGDVADVVRVKCGTEIGLPIMTNKVLQLCLQVDTNNARCYKTSQLTIDSGKFSVELSGLTPSIAAGDTVDVTYRVRAE